MENAYLLMHKNLTVADLFLDSATAAISAVGNIIRADHIPVGVSMVDGAIDRKALNSWWQGRAIPASRSGLRDALEKMQIESASLLLEKCLGLSLSDQYWICPSDSNLRWEQINFFDNPFSGDVGNILFGGHNDSGKLDLMSPDNTSDGNLKKRWAIMDGKRVLIKGGGGTVWQEPYNEVFASRVMERLGIPHVSYSMWFHDGYPHSLCENFLSRDTELISAWYVMQTAERKNDVSLYDHYLECCRRLGMENIRLAVDQMIVVDFLIANEDRHLNNFGVVRNADTLEYLGTAPIFDSGCSLWYNSPVSRILRHIDHPEQDRLKCRPFRSRHEEQLKLVKDFDWLDFSMLKGVADELYQILDGSEFIDAARRDALCRGVQSRISQLERFALSYQHGLSLKECDKESVGMGGQQM